MQDVTHVGQTQSTVLKPRSNRMVVKRNAHLTKYACAVQLPQASTATQRAGDPVLSIYLFKFGFELSFPLCFLLSFGHFPFSFLMLVPVQLLHCCVGIL